MTREQAQQSRRRGARRSTARPTVADVAREAGVSLITVSRVVNRASNVLASTREKVERAIAALGYVPNPAARSLAAGRECRIALLHSNPSAAYLSEFLMGGLAGTADSGAQLEIERWDGEESADLVAQRCAAHRIDGVLLPPPLCEHGQLLAALGAAGIPVAQVASGHPSPSASAVMIDDVQAARAITAHLIGLGHRRIGFIAGNPDQSASALRRMGYEQALADEGLPVDLSLMEQGDFTYRSGLVAAERLLTLHRPPTAVFASNDDMAAAVVSVAHRRHLDVPEDLSVCGFDDTAMATTVWPELTTIRQPVAEMARVATGLLLAAIRGLRDATAVDPQHLRLDYELIERGSSSPLRAKD